MRILNATQLETKGTLGQGRRNFTIRRDDLENAPHLAHHVPCWPKLMASEEKGRRGLLGDLMKRNASRSLDLLGVATR